DGQPVKPPAAVEDLKEIFSLESMRSDIYQFWGYRFDYKESEAKKPQKVFERLMAEIPGSLTMQRERMLDLIDGIIGAMVEESCPHNKPPEDWDWKGLREGFLEHFATKLGDDIEHLHALEVLAHKLYARALEVVESREKEMGTEMLLRIFRHYYLEEIDK